MDLVFEIIMYVVGLGVAIYLLYCVSGFMNRVEKDIAEMKREIGYISTKLFDTKKETEEKKPSADYDAWRYSPKS